jgi:hypothetical protein
MRNPQWAINLRDFPHNAHARFVDSVTNGKRNMPPWNDVLDPDEARALRASEREDTRKPMKKRRCAQAFRSG